MRITTDIHCLIEKKFDSVQYFQSGQHVYSEGEPSDGVYYIVEGKIKILKSGLNKQVTMWFCYPNEFIGIVPFFLNAETHDSTAVVTGATAKLIYISRKDFTDLMISYPDVQKEIVNELSKKISLTEMRITSSNQHSLKVRFIEAVAFLAEQEQDYGDQREKPETRTQLKLTVDNLSEISGISRKYLEKMLAKFEKKDLLHVESEDRVVIHDLNKFLSFK